MKALKDRFIKSWESTLLGIGIFALATVLLWTEKCTVMEFGGIMATGIYPFFKKQKRCKHED